MMIRAAIFDYGETLVVPSKPWEKIGPGSLKSVFLFLRKNGLELRYGEYLQLNRRLFRRYAETEATLARDIPDRLKYLDLVTELLPDLSDKKRARLAVRATDVFWKSVVDNYGLASETRACLRRLREMDIDMGLVSNHHSSEWLIRSLRRHRIDTYFRPIIASEKVGTRKPQPEIFRMCLNAMKTEARHAVFIGDSLENDVVGAKGVGMTTVLVGRASEGDSKPDFAIDSLAEVPPIISRLNRAATAGLS